MLAQHTGDRESGEGVDGHALVVRHRRQVAAAVLPRDPPDLRPAAPLVRHATDLTLLSVQAFFVLEFGRQAQRHTIDTTCVQGRASTAWR